LDYIVYVKLIQFYLLGQRAIKLEIMKFLLYLMLFMQIIVHIIPGKHTIIKKTLTQLERIIYLAWLKECKHKLAMI